MSLPRFLYIGADPQARACLESVARSERFGFQATDTPVEGIENLAGIFLDFDHDPSAARDFQARLRASATALPVVVLGDEVPFSTIVEAIRDGAIAYLPKPLQDSAALQAAREALKLNTAPDATTAAPLVALLLEDDRTHRKILTKLLETGDVDVRPCGSLEEARQLWAAGPTDFVVTDVNLPDGCGLDFVEEIHRDVDQREDRVPVVVITGSDDYEVPVRAVRCGAHDFIRKPLVPDLVDHAIRNVASLVRRQRRSADLERENDRFRDRLTRISLELDRRLRESVRELKEREDDGPERPDVEGIAGAIAHEINNPLTVAVGCAEILELQMSSGAVAGVGFGVVERLSMALDQCTRILRHRVEVERTGAGDPVDVDLGEIATRVLDLFEYSFRSGGIEVERELDRSVLRVHSWDRALDQVLTNLVFNARDAMPQGGRLTVSTRLDGEHGVVEVADTGHGIAADMLETVLKPHRTTKPAGKGSGLGLAISKSIAERHGGSLVLESQVGVGTRVRVRLPLKRARDATRGLRIV